MRYQVTDRDEPGLCVQTRRETDVLIITLQREDRRNAIDRSMADAIDAALNLLDDDGEIRCGVLTGGTRVFCAGSDLRSKGDYVTSRGGSTASFGVGDASLWWLQWKGLR